MVVTQTGVKGQGGRPNKKWLNVIENGTMTDSVCENVILSEHGLYKVRVADL